MALPLLRQLHREPGSSILIAATVALSVGVATALFGYLGSFLFPRLAAPEAERIGAVRIVAPHATLWSSSWVELEAIRAAGVFERIAANTAVNGTVRIGETRVFAWGQLVSDDFFSLFGGRAALGRTLSAEDDRPGAPPVIVLGHRLWRTAFGSNPEVVGRTVHVNREACTIVGVVERDFEGVGYAGEFFVPARLGDALVGLERSGNPQDRWLNVRGRVRDGAASWAEAEARLAAAFAGLDERSPLPEGERRMPRLVHETAFDPDSREDPFFLASRSLAGAGVLFVLLGAANLAGLLLARTTARDSEWAMRKALGATPGRLVTELVGALGAPVLLGLAGALAVAKLIEGWIERALATPLAGIGPGWNSEARQIFELDGRGLAFALGTTAVAFAVAVAPPLVRLLRRGPSRALRAAAPAGGDRSGLRARRILVAAQLGLAVTLLVTTGLLVRSLGKASAPALGFEPRGLAFATLHLPRSPGGAGEDRAAYLRLLGRARELPGVTAATIVLVPPLAPASRLIDVEPAEATAEPRSIEYNIVGPDYFAALGVPILAGRAFDERDAPGAAPAVVVSQALASQIWDRQPAVGRRLRVVGPTRPDEAGPEFEVVGVTADAAFAGPLQPHPPVLFFSYGQRRHSRMTLMVRSRAGLPAIEPALREAAAAVRSDASVIDLVAADEQLRRTLHPLRLYATVAGGLAAAGLATSLFGLCALQLQAVQLRRRAFAVRMAVGADRRDIAALVLRDGAKLTLWGVLGGLAGAAAVVRLLGSVLYGVSPFDPLTFTAVPLGLAAATLLAGWLPARRAAGVDPAANLRST